MIDNSCVLQHANHKEDGYSRHSSYSSSNTNPSCDVGLNSDVADSMIQSDMWPMNSSSSGINIAHPSEPSMHPLDPAMMFQPWNSMSNFSAQMKMSNNWRLGFNTVQAQQAPFMNANQQSVGMLPPNSVGLESYESVLPIGFSLSHTNTAPTPMRNTTQPIFTSANGSNISSTLINNATSSINPPFLSSRAGTRMKGRSASADQFSHKSRSHSKRSSSQPSVASVVSLTAHEPVSKMINGIEFITFLYSHDRLVKEYTVRTDVNSVDVDDIEMEFRIQNAIYPRANVDRSEYDGNRWDYETTCNQLGWKICWLNKDQLFGRRGLIQRAVDSYRNRHAGMRSRRVARQEKVANGTLRKRRCKKTFANTT
ncbi:hypothetical protein A0J61_07921 [Choanephora cucurbitarum]|uniref:DUF8032 domain-containing protein n=1 Tax=Choanephora cucurbitarum TaxID=101091 RepID=A0A1C7N5W6_9FUNG|nr:hypothetical protein A0J61_07921 [Choanephora cucurbitarum]